MPRPRLEEEENGRSRRKDTSSPLQSVCSESGTDLFPEDVPIKSEPLDWGEDYDDESADMPYEEEDLPDPSKIVKVKVESGDEDVNFGPAKRRKRKSQSRRKKVSEMTPDELERHRAKERDRKRRERAERRQKRRENNDGLSDFGEDDGEYGTVKGTESADDDADFVPAPKRKRKTKSRPSRRKKVSEMTPEELERVRAKERERKRRERAQKRESADGQSRPAYRRKRISELTPEELEKRREKWRRDALARREKEKNLTEEERALRKQKANAYMARSRARRTPEQIELAKIKQREAHQRKKMEKPTALKRLSEDTDPKLAEKIRERIQRQKIRRLMRLAEMTDEEKNQLRMTNYMQHVARMAKMTPEEREARRKYAREKVRERYLRLTPEERQKQNIRKSLWRKKNMDRFVEKRKIYEQRRKEQLKAEGKWEEYVEQRRAKARNKMRERTKVRRQTGGRKYPTKKRTFSSPEAEARYRECKRLSGAKYYLRKKLIAAGASQEEIDYQIQELIKTSQRVRPPTPRRRSESNKGDIANNTPAPTPTSTTHDSPADLNTKDEGDSRNNNAHLSFNPFTMRWGSMDQRRPDPTSANFQAYAAASASIYNLPPPPPVQSQFPSDPSQSQSEPDDLKELIDSASSSQYDGYDDDGGIDYSPDPPPPPQASPPRTTSGNPYINSPSTQATFQTDSTIQSNQEQRNPSVSSAPAAAFIPVPPPAIKPDMTDANNSNNNTSGPVCATSTNNEFRVGQGKGRKKGDYRPLFQSLRPSAFEKNYKCSACGNFYDQRTIKIHIKNVHHPYFKKGTCTICGLKLSLASQFHRHFKEVHGGTGDVAKGTVTYTIVDRSQPQTNAAQVQPMHDPGPEEDYRKETIRDAICDECGNAYQAYYLPTHKKRYHPTHFKNGECTICGEKFPKGPLHFFRHYEKVHQGPKKPMRVREAKFVCEECGKACTSKWYLDEHRCFMHGIGLDPNLFFECPVCPDKPRFKRRHFLNKHFKRNHPNDRIPGPLKCPSETCSMTFAQEKKMPEHVTKEHPECCFPCQYCGAVKFSQMTLNTHYSANRCNKISKEDLVKKKKEIGDNTLDRIKVHCELCNAEVMLASMKHHYQRQHTRRAKEDKIRCLGCDKEMRNREDLAAHHADFHRMQPEHYLDYLSKLHMKDRSTVSTQPLGNGKGWKKFFKGVPDGPRPRKNKKPKPEPKPKRKPGRPKKVVPVPQSEEENSKSDAESREEDQIHESDSESDSPSSEEEISEEEESSEDEKPQRRKPKSPPQTAPRRRGRPRKTVEMTIPDIDEDDGKVIEWIKVEREDEEESDNGLDLE